jgi:hypothetical protein
MGDYEEPARMLFGCLIVSGILFGIVLTVTVIVLFRL